MTAGELVRAAGRLIAWHPGQSGSSDEQAAGLDALNAMLDAWNAQRLAIYSIRQQIYSLTGGQQNYTLGPGGDWSGERPVRIERANVILPAALHRPLEIISVDDWAALRLPTLESTFPTRLYYDRAFPLTTLRFWPAPTEGHQVELFTWSKLGRFASLNDTADFPEGYQEAITYNLALRLAQELRAPLPDFVVVQARESLANLKRLNLPRPVMSTEPVLGEARWGFNWRTGE
jgi:hypothetical protein